MKQHTSPHHTEHMKVTNENVQVFHIRNRSTGVDVRLSIHTNPCVTCADHLCHLIWHGFNVTANLNPQSDESPATPSGRPT